MTVNGRSRLGAIAKQFGLPEWWVESVLVEYYPCRKFLEGKDVWLFNFDLIEDEIISSLPSKKVVIGSYVLFHNIQSRDLKSRFILALIGDPLFPLKAEILPEGPVNPYYIPFISNPIDVWDPKLGFSDRAIVFDDGTFYQWKIAEFYSISGTNQGWWKSQLFVLGELKVINDQIQKIRNTEITTENKPDLNEKLRILYEQLEEVREPLRQKIWEYHESEKNKKSPSQLSETQPPLLTPFDSLDLQEGKYRVRTHLEPLLYRASLRHLKNANEAFLKKRSSLPLRSEIFVDEIEASAICILCAHSCLEAYIDYVLEDYCSAYLNITRRMSVIQKWFVTPHLLGSRDCFIPDQKPFSEFVELNNWRNEIAHFEHKWKKVARVKSVTEKVGKVIAICNASNAKNAVNTIRAMIEQLSSKTNIPKPRWLDPGVTWLKDLV